MASKLYFKYAAMGSGKSGQLLMSAHQMEERGVPFLCLKSEIDTRDGIGVISSRVGIKRECVTVNRNDDLFVFVKDYCEQAWMKNIAKPLWIFVDECQFLTQKQVAQLTKVVDELDINVVCYGLRTDFKASLFEGSKMLFELSDEISEIKSTCSCGRDAVVNARVGVDGGLIIDGEQVMVGGNELYVPLCRKCYSDMYEAAVKKRMET